MGVETHLERSPERGRAKAAADRCDRTREESELGDPTRSPWRGDG